MGYGKDRQFTDIVHKKALDKIYPLLQWEKVNVDENEQKVLSKWLDINIGFDYIFKDQYKNQLFVQERFRENSYLNYNDFTIRYRRDYNAHQERRLSEFYKIKADFLVYGIIDVSKEEVLNGVKFDFVKYIVVNLELLFCIIRNGNIKIEGGDIKQPRLKNGILYCPVKQNSDNSSSFVVFDVPKLVELSNIVGFNLEELIILEKGYINSAFR